MCGKFENEWLDNICCQKGSKLGGKLVTSSNLLKFEEELYNILLSKEVPN